MEDVLDARALGPVFTRNDHDIPSHTLNFNAATPSTNVAATIEELKNPGTTTEGTIQASTDLTNNIAVHTAPSMVNHTPNLSIVATAMSVPTASAIVMKGARAYSNTQDMAAMY